MLSTGFFGLVKVTSISSNCFLPNDDFVSTDMYTVHFGTPFLSSAGTISLLGFSLSFRCVFCSQPRSIIPLKVLGTSTTISGMLCSSFLYFVAHSWRNSINSNGRHLTASIGADKRPVMAKRNFQMRQYQYSRHLC